MKLRTLVLIAASLAAGSSFAGDSEVWFANHTGHAIREIYLSPAGTSQWGGDRLLDSAAVANKQKILLKFGARLACVQDLKVVYEDNDATTVLKGLDMCETEIVSLRVDPATKTTVALRQ